MENRLYVVFHGLISLVEDQPNGIFRALLLEMPDHRVAAGHWLTERAIAKGSRCHLEGVERGKASLDPNRNVIVNSKELNQEALSKFLYARIDLPLPERTFSFSMANLKAELRGSTTRASSSNFSATHAFQYRLTEDSPILMADTDSSFSFKAQAGVNVNADLTVTTIHIVNEPEVALPITIARPHGAEEFRRGAVVLGSDLTITAPPQIPDNDLEVPAGLLKAEILALSARELEIFRFVGSLRVQKSLPEPGDDHGSHLVCGAPHAVIRGA